MTSGGVDALHGRYRAMSSVPRKKLKAPRLVHIGKAKAHLIAAWKEGVSLYTETGEPIDALLLGVAAARLRLARQHHRAGLELSAMPRPRYRDAVSRYYYSMYHALRSAAYVYHMGDDHESHTELPKHIPGDFPGGGDWANKLKSARETRNRADYDPYPSNDGAWKQEAGDLRSDADNLLVAVRSYLRSKGCKV